MPTITESQARAMLARDGLPTDEATVTRAWAVVLGAAADDFAAVRELVRKVGAGVELRAMIAAPGACKCPTRYERGTGLYLCPCCGFRGRQADHLAWSAAIAGGATADEARQAGAASRRRVRRLLELTGWAMPTGECWEHPRPLADEGQLELFGEAGQAWNGPEVPEAERIPAAPFTYYLGGRPNWLIEHVPTDVPLMIAAPTLARYRDTSSDRFNLRRWGGWFGDSGAFMALTGSGTNRGDVHPWHLDADEYGGMWVRLISDVGMPDFVAPQDMPCEPIVRERTGLTVRQHIDLTVDNFVHLRENFPMVPWIPVLQGWDRDDYLYCEARYLAAGVDLAAEPLVGVGSICRRGTVPAIVEVLELFAARGYRLHGFGVKVEALPVIGHLLASADSYAWSTAARKRNLTHEGCDHRSRAGERTDCRNCPRWAVAWRERVLEAYTAGTARDLLELAA